MYLHTKGSRFYHRSDCRMVEANKHIIKDTITITNRDIFMSKLWPCAVCRPPLIVMNKTKYEEKS